MARKEASLRCCMVVQQLAPSYFKGWSPTELSVLDQENPVWDILQIFYKRLSAGGIEVEEGYGILHDKDVQEIYNEQTKQMVLKPKAEHFHIVLKFAKAQTTPPTISNISRLIGVEPQFIDKAQRGAFAYSNMLAYLIHIKYSDKYQYKPNDVRSLVKKDTKGNIIPSPTYMDVYRENYKQWVAGRAFSKKKKAKQSIDVLIEQILTGELTKEQIVLNDDLYTIYSRYFSKCEEAFNVYGERRAYQTIQALKNGEFKLSVFFIVGSSGAGKTRLALKFTEKLIEKSTEWFDKPWRVCQTASSNALDDYAGEEILLMDDLRGVSMVASDWLKLLDPYNISPASARYHNKVPACRVIIITSTKEPIEFFYYCKHVGGGDRSEAMDQFIRRIQLLVHVFHADKINDKCIKLSPSVECDTYTHLVDSTAGHAGFDNNGNRVWVDRYGNRLHVKLHHKFEDSDYVMYTSDDAIANMIEVVDRNTHLLNPSTISSSTQSDPKSS